MQVRGSSFSKAIPVCPRDPGQRLHRHGGYERYADCDSEKRLRIPRFRCPRCGLTFSMLPSEKLPYIAPPASQLQENFDAVASGTDPPPLTERARGCLRRAWKSLAARVTPLCAMFGQLISTIKPNTGELWMQMRQHDDLEGILRFLADHFKSSLLADYLCLRLSV